MATYRIIAWQNIPAAVEVRDGTGQVTLQLSERFQAADRLRGHAARPARQRRVPRALGRDRGEERTGSASEVGAAVVAELEERFPEYIAQAFGRA